uniref:CHHC U11-48K-type domain-containing protein n=1 Tax=Glossina morsitans morsitans TaxID=37546 RepID=A0A1B0G8S2_GLOMM
MSNLLQCPYEKSHQILESRMQFHLIRCQRNHPNAPKGVCPFNVTDVFNDAELEFHLKTTTSPPKPKYESTENWDDEPPVRSYNPSEHARKAPVLRSFPGTEKSSSQTNHVRTRDDNSNYWSSGNIKIGMLPHKQMKRNQLSAQYYNNNNNPDHLSKTGNAAKDDANANLPNYRSYDAGAYSKYYVPSTNQYSVHATGYSVGSEMEENIPFDVYGTDGQYPGSGGEYSYTFPIAQKSIASKNRSELSHKALLAKSFLIPLASAAVLGIAAALVSNPLLLQLGTVSSAGPIVVGKRKRRDLLILAPNSK